MMMLAASLPCGPVHNHRLQVYGPVFRKTKKQKGRHEASPHAGFILSTRHRLNFILPPDTPNLLTPLTS